MAKSNSAPMRVRSMSRIRFMVKESTYQWTRRMMSWSSMELSEMERAMVIVSDFELEFMCLIYLGETEFRDGQK